MIPLRNEKFAGATMHGLSEHFLHLTVSWFITYKDCVLTMRNSTLTSIIFSFWIVKLSHHGNVSYVLNFLFCIM